MQEITITKQVLLAFSTEYGRLPDVTIDNPLSVVGTHILAVAWMSAYIREDGKTADQLSLAFMGWLCGRGEFTLAGESEHEFIKALVALVSDVVNVQEMADGKKQSR